MSVHFFLLREGDWKVKLDMKDAYLTLPVHPSFQKYLCFELTNRIYQFSCLAFELAPAPKVFTKFLKIIMALLRKGASD